MVDPHTKESRGFGFVKMVTAEQADAAKEGLQGEVIEGRTLSIEKARRSRPRTPTPGKYFGPPKRGKSSYPWVLRIQSTANLSLLQTSVDLVAAAAVVTVMMTDVDLTVAAGVAAAVVVTTTVMVVMTPTVIVVTMAVVAMAAANTATILVVSTVTTTATVVALIATPPVVVVAVKSGTVASLAVTIVVAIMIVMLTLPATATPLLPANRTLAALMNPVVVKTDTVAGR